MKRIIALIVVWLALIAIVAVPVSATTIYDNCGGASQDMIEANQLFYGHCSK